MNVYWVVFAVFITLVAILSLVLSIYILVFFKKLSKGVGKGELIKVLSRLMEIEKQNSDNIKQIEKIIQEIKTNASYHIQKTALIRFNPFSELGGDHSFVLTLLDDHFTGYIITGLHTRERTRIYVKKIEKGKSVQDLSKEEKEALKKASQ